MMTVDELNKIRQKSLALSNQNRGRTVLRISACMATGGIAAGSQTVIDTIEEELVNLEGMKVEVVPKGCIGMCRLDPLVDVVVPGQDKCTYVKMTPEKIRRVIHEHVLGGVPVLEYTLHVANNIILNDYTLLR